MSNNIGDVKGITGNSMSLNGQAGQGGVKPMPSGSGNPGGTKPDKPAEKPTPMPK